MEFRASFFDGFTGSSFLGIEVVLSGFARKQFAGFGEFQPL